MPFIPGEIATLQSLKSKKYNQEVVTIAEFNHNRLRFVVVLKNNKRILVKACDLSPSIDLSQNEQLASLLESSRDPKNQSVSKLEEM